MSSILSTEEQDIQNQLDKLMNLVANHKGGKDDEIEDAVSSFLQQVPVVVNHPLQKVMYTDDQNYDDDEDDAPDINIGNNASLEDRSRDFIPKTATLESLRKQQAALDAEESKFDISASWKDIDSIPLGSTGAKLMIIFGDGPKPDPKACSLALLSTRECLQNAIKDARALRRKLREEFQKARAAVNFHKIKKKERSVIGPEGMQGIDMSMYFKAIYGHDKLCFDIPSGFDEQQLEMLFPEEMNQYKKFNKMHNVYTKAKNSKGIDGDEADGSDAEDEKDELQESAQSLNSELGGHIQERLSQFDLRTERMLDNWYLTFSEVRKGSFLDRGGMSSEDRVWEQERKKSKGRKKSSTWESLPASHVAFLYWIGFDQRSALPPPDTATTEALAFLAYDFFGKIIEKAILLRCLKNGQQDQHNNDKSNKEIILELSDKEQLTKADIEEALKDTIVVPKPLYNASNSVLSTTQAVQTYFGPGFEDRIEIELDQITSGVVDRLTDTEKEIRIKEDELFHELKKPPKRLDGITDVLHDASKSEAVSKHRCKDKKAREKREVQKMISIQDVINGKKRGINPDVGAKRKRGRPRKNPIPKTAS